mmetsp:Transcript_4009/g.25202  ORF Transcript_4009/g.25202 Transcript_4009/m.25202 type:complete len:230 (+) Transcript_4009:2405-3094(+)
MALASSDKVSSSAKVRSHSASSFVSASLRRRRRMACPSAIFCNVFNDVSKHRQPSVLGRNVPVPGLGAALARRSMPTNHSSSSSSLSSPCTSVSAQEGRVPSFVSSFLSKLSRMLRTTARRRSPIASARPRAATTRAASTTASRTRGSGSSRCSRSTSTIFCAFSWATSSSCSAIATADETCNADARAVHSVPPRARSKSARTVASARAMPSRPSSVLRSSSSAASRSI